MDTDFSTLQNTWIMQNEKIDRLVRVNRALLEATGSEIVRSVGQRVTRTVVFELLGNGLALVLFGSFLFDHIREPGLTIPTAFLYFLTILGTILLVRELVETRKVDVSSAILENQRHIARMQMLRIRYLQGVFLVAPLAWVPLLVVSLRGVFGIDAYAVPGNSFLIANLVFCILLIPIGIWFGRAYGQRLRAVPILGAIIDRVSGHGFQDAMNRLASLDDFMEV